MSMEPSISKNSHYKREIELILNYCHKRDIDSLIIKHHFNDNSDDTTDTYYDKMHNIYRVGNLVHPMYHRKDYQVYRPVEFALWLIEIFYDHPRTQIRRSDKLLQMRKRDLEPLVHNVAIRR